MEITAILTYMGVLV